MRRIKIKDALPIDIVRAVYGHVFSNHLPESFYTDVYSRFGIEGRMFTPLDLKAALFGKDPAIALVWPACHENLVEFSPPAEPASEEAFVCGVANACVVAEHYRRNQIDWGFDTDWVSALIHGNRERTTPHHREVMYAYFFSRETFEV
jgi:hypothetical protein